VQCARRELLPISLYRAPSRPQRFEQTLRSVLVDGGTPLYTTIEAGCAPSAWGVSANALVVLTDGVALRRGLTHRHCGTCSPVPEGGCTW